LAETRIECVHLFLIDAVARAWARRTLPFQLNFYRVLVCDFDDRQATNICLMFIHGSDAAENSNFPFHVLDDVVEPLSNQRLVVILAA